MNTLYNYGLTKIALSKEPGQSDFDYYTKRIKHDSDQYYYGLGGAIAGGLGGALLGNAFSSVDTDGHPLGAIAGAAVGALPGLLYGGYHGLRVPYDGIQGMASDTPTNISPEKLTAAKNAQRLAAANGAVGLASGIVRAVNPELRDNIGAGLLITGAGHGTMLGARNYAGKYKDM